MQLCRKILEILAHARIVVWSEDQFLKEKLPGFRRIRDRIELQNVMIGAWIDVRDTISKTRLFRDILLDYAAVIILQHHLLHLNRAELRNLLGRKLAARLQLGAAVSVQ